VCGAAGVGKTQICMQQCVNVQIAASMGGLGGQAVYIDTEGSFVSGRAAEIAQATVRALAAKQPRENNFSVESVMSNIFLYRCVDHVQLISVVNNLGRLIEKHKRVSSSRDLISTCV
jgi:RAD51-like protein 2